MIHTEQNILKKVGDIEDKIGTEILYIASGTIALSITFIANVHTVNKYKWFFVGGLICLIVAIIIHLALKVKTTFIYKAINKLKFELNQNDKSEEKMIKQLHKKIKEIVYYSNVYIAVPFVFLVIGIIFLCTFTVLNM